MTIQLITKNVLPASDWNDVTLSLISAPKSLDEFEVNIIDISSPELWINQANTNQSINAWNDFKSIQTMVRKKVKSKLIYVLPQNIKFYYGANRYGGKLTYSSFSFLKDIIDIVYQNIMIAILPPNIQNLNLIYENTRTTINSFTYVADFYFDRALKYIIQSNLSKKTTAVPLIRNDVFATTLNITQSYSGLLNFINFLFYNQEKSPVPDWLSTISFGNDDEQRQIIENSNKAIALEQKRIEDAEIEISKNAKYKSILYTNGDELVEVVFEILEKLLDCDLSDFVDKKKEDFLIKKSGCTFIGEIKGITSNVKNTNITQVELHYQEYTDKLAEDGQSEKVQPILIINPSRNKEPQQRDPVDEQQVALAKRNNCLIIETMTLLRIFEKFLAGEISSDKCVEVFSTCTGLLNESHFDSSTPEELEAYKG